MHLACIGSHTEIATALLDMGADINTVEPRTGDTALLLTMRQAVSPELALVLIERGAWVGETAVGGMPTVLHYAARNGWARVCEQLLLLGADAGALVVIHGLRGRATGRTPLQLACEQGHDEVVSVLVKYMSPELINLTDVEVS